jgi:hypothetical protein
MYMDCESFYSYGNDTDNDTDNNETCPEYICYESDCMWHVSNLSEQYRPVECMMENCVEQCYGEDGECSVHMISDDNETISMDCDTMYDFVEWDAYNQSYSVDCNRTDFTMSYEWSQHVVVHECIDY